MRYQYETVLPAASQSFVTVDEVGSVVDCVFHVHPELELTFVESSFGVRFVGDNIAEFEPGDLVLIGSLLPHHYYNDPKDSDGPTWSRLKVIKWRQNIVGSELLGLPEFAPVRRLFLAARAGVAFPQPTAQACRQLIDRVFEAEGALRVIYLLQLLTELADSEYAQLSPQLCNATLSAPDARMQRVLAFIHARLDGESTLNLKEVARVACMTPPAFSRYFHQHARRRFIDYVNELRIGRACGLLVNSDQTVLDISLSTGYRNLSNFNRHFARFKGCSPREFRKRARAAGLV